MRPFSGPTLFVPTADRPVRTLLLFMRLLGFGFWLLSIGWPPAFCQGDPTTEAGIMPFRTYQFGDIDTINPMNGNVMLHIPLFSLPQRGRVKLTFSLTYGAVGKWFQSETCTPPPHGTCKANFGRSGTLWGPMATMESLALPSKTTHQWIINSQNGTAYRVVTASITDSTGATHALGYDSSNLSRLHSTDSSGYLFVPSDPTFYSDTTTLANGTVYGPDGISQIWNFTAPVSGLVSISDPDGNTIHYTNTSTQTTGSGYYTDTLGRTIANPAFLSGNLPSSTTGCPSITASYQPLVGSQSWSVPGPTGQTATYLFCYASVNVSSEEDGTPFINTKPALQSVVLPDGTYWTFIYQSANPSGSAPAGDGDLIEVITPYGGSIAYTFATGFFCNSSVSVTRALLTRTVSDGQGNVSKW